MYKLIIADDERMARESIAAAVDWGRFDVELVGLASNGIEALEMIKSLSPHVVLMDIKMPGMSGIKVIQEVREQFPDIRFIIVSGYAEFEYARSAMRLGVMHYLLKPFSMSELEEALVGSLDYFTPQTAAEPRYKALDMEDDSRETQIADKLVQRIETVKRYVEENIGNPDISLGMVSKQIVFMSSDYFGKVFRKATGQYYTQYVMERRIENAKVLLETTSDKVWEIAERVGFIGNHKYFGDVFRRYTGFTPGEFRKRSQENN